MWVLSFISALFYDNSDNNNTYMYMYNRNNNNNNNFSFPSYVQQDPQKSGKPFTILRSKIIAEYLE